MLSASAIPGSLALSASDLGPIFAHLVAALRTGETILLLADFDGTLVPIVRDPTDAWLPSEVRNDLHQLTRSGRGWVASVSGRRLDDLRVRVRLPAAIYAGCHGLEIEGPGIAFRHDDAEARRETLLALAEALRRRTAAIPGVLVEPKGLAIAIHYRRSPPRAASLLEAALAQVIGPRRDEFWLLRGKKVIEILPTDGWSKGQCALRIRDHVRAHAGAAPATIVLGDDATDELAFLALRADALTVKVGGHGRSYAAYRVRDVADVHCLLSALAAEVRWRIEA
jgi:trehalose 6-phosphate phosphatase